MTTFKQFKASLFAFVLLTLSHTLHAQFEVTHLILKGQSATGFGAFFHGGFAALEVSHARALQMNHERRVRFLLAEG